jgi:hypothetical protein
MKLYRNISEKELASLINEGTIRGIFDGGSSQRTSYKGEYGAVICTFRTCIQVLSSLVIEIEVNEEDLLGSGVGLYWGGVSVEELYIEKYHIDLIKVQNINYPFAISSLTGSMTSY